jgi:hypothetical protein
MASVVGSAGASEPPVTQLGMLSIGLVAAGVIDLAAHLPRHTSLAAPVVLLVAAVLAAAMAVALLARKPSFAWRRFRQVFSVMLGAYLVVGGMIVYAFVYDHTHGATLAVMVCLLATFVLDVALVPAYTVARYER